MSVYVIKRKDQKPNEMICSAPSFEMAVQILKDMEQTDRELRDYKEDRYGIIRREYCPVDEYGCDKYMLGICSMRYPVNCTKYLEAELEKDTDTKTDI